MAVLPPDPVFCYKEDMGQIHSLNFCVRGENFVSHLLAGTEKGGVYFWDLETNRLHHKQAMGKSIQAIHTFDYKVLTQEKEGSVKLWSVRKSSYEVEKETTCGIGFCKSILINEALIVPQENSCVDVLQVTDLTKIKQLNPGRENLGQVMALQKVTIGNSCCVMAAYETGDVVLWDLNTFQPCGHIKLQEHLTSLTFDPYTKRAVCGAASNMLQVFTIDSSYQMALKAEVSITNEGCNIVKLRPDGKVLVSGGWDGRLRVFSWRTLRILAVLAEHKNTIMDIQYSPHPVNYWKSNIMAACGGDGVISLWNLYN
uniref:Guanine nucleotide-binding protein subunit beta-like protein 1 isoform X1 n=2 Tax=Diabrotica virgifera virgifera TaxID=50390 RepID=A0A6P7F9J6_DIAVI